MLDLLTAWKANKSEMRCWGKKYNFIQKDWEDGGLMSQKKPSDQGQDARVFYRTEIVGD